MSLLLVSLLPGKITAASLSALSRIELMSVCHVVRVVSHRGEAWRLAQAGRILQGVQGQDALVLSWLYSAANDNYAGRPVVRLSASVKALLWGLHRYSLDDVSEIIIVDWVGNANSTLINAPELIAVWKDYSSFLGEHKGLKIRVLQVNQIETEQFVQPPLTRMSEVHALNAAAQRAHGSYLLRLDQDTAVGSGFFQFLQSERQQGWPHLFQPWFGGRRDMDEQQTAAALEDPVSLLDQPPDDVSFWRGSLHDEKTMSGAVGVLGVPTYLWRAMRGYDEHYVGWGHMELELFDRMKLVADTLSISEKCVVAAPFFHLDHPRDDSEHRAQNTFPSDQRPFWNNSLTWGLAAMSLPERVFPIG